MLDARSKSAAASMLLALALVVQLLATTALGLGTSDPLDTNDEIEDLDQALCEDYATLKVSKACADWVNRCCRTWPRHFDPMGLAIAPDGDRLYVASTGRDFGEPVTIAAIDAHTGQTLWANTTPGGPEANGPGIIALGPNDERVFITGEGDEDIMTVAFNTTTGEQLWTARHRNDNGPDMPRDLVVGPQGERVYVSGDRALPYSQGPFVTLAYDAGTGAEVWVAGHPGGLSARAIDVSPDGSRVYVSGVSPEGAEPEQDYVTIAYNASTGQQAWIQPSNGGVEALVVSPSGEAVYITGNTVGASATIAYNATTGEQRWRSDVQDGGWVNTLAMSPDGARLVITGGTYDFDTIMYDASTGARHWIIQPSFGPFAEEARDVVFSPNGSTLFLAGLSYRYNDFVVFGEGFPDMITAAFHAHNGSMQWTARYNGAPGGWDIPDTVEAAPDGSQVYVLGRSDEAGSGAMATLVAYDAGGPNPVLEPLINETT